MNIIEQIEAEQVAALIAERPVPAFTPGDTVRVNVKVVEGNRERVQAFEGVCIAKKNAGLNSAFTVRKISYGEGVERVFPLHSPRIASIEVVRRGAVRRAKLYYLRGRRGKSARIAEETTGYGAKLEAQARKDAAAAAAARAAEKEAQRQAQMKAQEEAEAAKKAEAEAAAAEAAAAEEPKAEG